MLLLSVFIVSAEDLRLNISMEDITPKEKVVISPECDKEFTAFFQQDVTFMMRDYCSGVNTNLITILILAMLIWITEPMIKKGLEKSNNARYAFFIKWLGLGLMAIVLIGLWFARG
jgi:hypothetical protein